MADGPLIIQKDNVDDIPRVPGEVPPWYAQPGRRQDWRVVAVLCAFGLLALLIAGVALRPLVLDEYARGPAKVLQVALLGLLVAAAVAGALALLGLAARAWMVRQPSGVTMTVLQTAQLDAQQVIGGALRTQYAYAAREMPHVAALTLTNPRPEPPAQIIEQAPESDVVRLVPPDLWLGWLLEQPHTMIAGATGSGKTTFARIALGERIRAGYQVLVVDPKGKEWYGAPVVGGGRKFADILAALDGVRAEMDQRFTAYGAGERSFEPLVVLVDEVPDIMDACLDDRRRLVDARWVRFVRQLGSLAREVQISVILMTQSPLVEDIGMNSAMRKNFSRVALGDEAPALLREERDAKRRAALGGLLRGQTHPAALYWRGEVHLLDTSTVPLLAARHVGAVSGWQPAQQLPQRPAPSREAATLKLLVHARRRGLSREKVRALYPSVPFENALWTLAGDLADGADADGRTDGGARRLDTGSAVAG
jgi:hypothetical protein